MRAAASYFVEHIARLAFGGFDEVRDVFSGRSNLSTSSMSSSRKAAPNQREPSPYWFASPQITQGGLSVAVIGLIVNILSNVIRLSQNAAILSRGHSDRLRC